MLQSTDPRAVFSQAFGGAAEVAVVSAPGRVNLIGEHIDYHGLPVLPVALRRSVRVAFRPSQGRRIRAVSGTGYGPREFEWAPRLDSAPAGDWENYLRAAAEAVAGKWGVGRGIDAAVVSDLPPAAGLSSSSALLVAFTLALLRAAGQCATFEELMEVLPEGERFVGTRGGGMDHAASLGSRAGCASLIRFDPLSLTPVPLPPDWCFLAAHSLQTAEKSAGVRDLYNARRNAGHAALARMGFRSYYEAIAGRSSEDLRRMAADRLEDRAERDAFVHVSCEALRVQAAVDAIRREDAAGFGQLILESHASLRDRLQVSAPALDRLVEAAMEFGALGARLTGAGFGGCAVVFCLRAGVQAVRRGLMERFYFGEPEFDEKLHLIDASPGPGALFPEES